MAQLLDTLRTALGNIVRGTQLGQLWHTTGVLATMNRNGVGVASLRGYGDNGYLLQLTGLDALPQLGDGQGQPSGELAIVPHQEQSPLTPLRQALESAGLYNAILNSHGNGDSGTHYVSLNVA